MKWEVAERIRPIRVAARRQGEFLCALAYQELEWFAIDDVDAEGLEIPDEYVSASGTPVFDNIAEKPQDFDD